MVNSPQSTPQHIAIIMDGNGRWAQQRGYNRTVGHLKGVDALRETIRACDAIGVSYLTVFAFSSENWQRPPSEVVFLLRLFRAVLLREVQEMQRNNIKLKVVGDLAAFDQDLRQVIDLIEKITAKNTGLVLTICANYSGRWDVTQAADKAFAEIGASKLQEKDITERLAMAYAPEPDLLIRTGGELRISNFMLWSLAYTELYFSELNWPDFDEPALQEAIAAFQLRDRRFGGLSKQATSLPTDRSISPIGRWVNRPLQNDG
jgi:undecaprenyl diphosphate synthase